MSLQLLINMLDDKENQCMGLFFKAKINNFVNTRGEVIHSVRMVPIKRRSCPGCSACDYLKDDLSEQLKSGGEFPIIKDASDGDIYELKATNFSTDWETGYIDGWDLEFVKQRNSSAKVENR